MGADQDVRDSKRMSRILRHFPRDFGVTLDHEGWASVTDLSRGSGLSEDRIRSIAVTNTRYELSPDGSRIRALHGHSVDVGYGDPVSPPDVLYHGTSAEGLEAILSSGAILPMRRTMVHLSVSRDRAEEVGRRHGDPVVITVDAERMAGDGIVFHLSGDGVYLTDRVPTEYFISWDRTAPSDVLMARPVRGPGAANGILDYLGTHAARRDTSPVR